MLKATFCRPLSCFLASTRIGATNLQRTRRSSFRLFATTSMLCDTKRVNNTPRTSDGSGANEYRPPDASNHKASPFNWEILRTRVRELSDRSFVAVRQRADDFTAKTASTFSLVGSHLNRVTGYEEIEALKRRVVEQGVYTSFFDRKFHALISRIRG